MSSDNDREPKWERPVTRARRLRRDSTVPERILWSYLRAGRLGGLKFRRQHAIKPFIVDFFCHDASLVIELDGETHVGRVEEDEARTRWLEGRGVHVIRFTNDDVLNHIEAVVNAIAKAAGLDW